MRWFIWSIVAIAIAAFAMAIKAGFHQSNTLAAETAQAYKLEGGPLPVGSVDTIRLYDAARDKELELKAYYPDAVGPYPVIVFSHGMGGSKDVGGGLMAYWASHGYAVLCPTHADSIALYKREHPDEIEQWYADGGRGHVIDMLHRIAGRPEDWKNRSADISFVIDSLDVIEALAPELAGKLDTEAIGVGGHSYGAYTTMLIGGAVVDPPGMAPAQCWRDEQPQALLVMSGQGVGRLGLNPKSWDGFDRPMMVMSGSRDKAAGGLDVVSRRDPFDYAPAGNKYLVWIEDAVHASFTGSLASDDLAERCQGLWVEWVTGASDVQSGDFQKIDQVAIFDYVKTASLAFWDAHLKSAASAQEWLASGSLAEYSAGDAELEWK